MEVDEAEDAKKEEKKSWTFKKVNKWDGNGLDIFSSSENWMLDNLFYGDAGSLRKRDKSNTSSKIKNKLMH